MHGLILPPGAERLWPFTILYFSPDSIMPLTSAIAGAIGILLIFWRQLARLARRAFRFVRARLQRSGPGPAPEPGPAAEQTEP
jgi:hypothetical protein